jgi:Tfp pilus assembly protein PilF
MSVILKALRAQNDDGASGPSSQGAGQADSFQVDNSVRESPKEGGPGSGQRQLILLIVLVLSIILFVMLQYWDSWFSSPPPAVPPAPAPKVAIVVPVVPAQVAPSPSAPGESIDSLDNDLQMARSQYKSGEYDDSLKLFQKVIDQDPNNAIVHNDMGLVLLKKELYASAEGHFAKALELDDACAECYNNLGYLKTTLDQPIEAEKYLQKAIVLKPDYADPYFNLAVMYEKNGDVGKAVEYYRDYLQKIPKTETELAAKIKSRIQDLAGD